MAGGWFFGARERRAIPKAEKVRKPLFPEGAPRIPD
jgi:hypothetical protein